MNNYFNQDYKKEEVNESVNESMVPVIGDLPTLIRSKESGDKVYYVQGHTKHWVTSPEVLKALGYELGQEKEIDKNLMSQLQSGEPIRMQNVNEYILPIEEEPPVVEQEEIPGQEVDNAVVEGYFSIIIPCILTVYSVTKLLVYIENLRKYFSGEIITVVKNDISYTDYSPKFGNKVIECEQLAEGVERAIRVARGEAIVANEVS